MAKSILTSIDSQKEAKDRRRKLFEIEILRDLRSISCLVAHLGTVQRKDPDLISHVAKAD